MLLDLVLEHERLGIPCSIAVLVFSSSCVQIAGRFTNIEASPTWRTKLTLQLVVDTTAAAVAAISLASTKMDVKLLLSSEIMVCTIFTNVITMKSICEPMEQWSMELGPHLA